MKNNYCDVQDNCEIVNKLKATLVEIKEIAESRRYYPCSWCIYKEILQKISEVIPNEN